MTHMYLIWPVCPCGGAQFIWTIKALAREFEIQPHFTTLLCPCRWKITPSLKYIMTQAMPHLLIQFTCAHQGLYIGPTLEAGLVTVCNRSGAGNCFFCNLQTTEISLNKESKNSDPISCNGACWNLSVDSSSTHTECKSLLRTFY